MTKKDVFGLGSYQSHNDGDSDAIDDDDDETSEDGDEDEDEDDVEFTILEMTPAAGWTAVFGDGTNTKLLGLACFALVEITSNGHEPMRQIRPMVALETGEVEDVELLDSFVCIVPPGMDSKEFIAVALQSDMLLDDSD